jgi:hypothetical protein
MPKLKIEPENLKRSVLMAIMIPEDLDLEIKRVCQENGVNRSQGVRWMLNKVLKRPTMLSLKLK